MSTPEGRPSLYFRGRPSSTALHAVSKALSAMEIVLTESTRGKSLLVIDKFTYYKQKELKNGEIFWRCTKKSSNCGAKVFTVGVENKISRSQLAHNHEPDLSRVNRQILFTACKRRAQEDITEKPSKIINGELAKDLPVSVTPKDINYIRRNIYNTRQKLIEDQTTTTDEEEEELPEDSNAEPEEPSKSDASNKKWQNIRDAFIKSLKKISEQPSAKKYLYYDNLKFLIKIIQKEDTEMEKPVESANNESTTEEVRRISPAQEDTYREILRAVRNEKTEPDEDEAFFMSIIPSVRKMSDENKLEFRLGVLQLMKDINNHAKDPSGVGSLLFAAANSSNCHPSTSFSHFPSPNTNSMTCCQQSHLT